MEADSVGIHPKELKQRAAGSSAPACSVFRCVGNIGGCDKTGDARCTITVNGPPTQASEHLYMCPFNHWRSARWEITPNAPGQARVPASLEAGRSECDWCLRKVGTHVFTNDIGDRFLRRNAHKDGKGNECLHSFAIVAELPNNVLTVSGGREKTNGQ